MSNVWIVAYGDGSYALMDELPIVALVTEEYLNKLDAGEPIEIDCEDDGHGLWEAHMHIKELVLESYWDETRAGITALDLGGEASMVIGGKSNENL